MCHERNKNFHLETTRGETQIILYLILAKWNSDCQSLALI